MRTKLKDNEKLLLIIKKHYIVFLKPVLILIAFIYIHTSMATDSTGGSMAKLYLSFGKYFSYIYVGIICYIAYVFFDRQKNIWIVTDMRFIDEWGIITYKSKESQLDKINNVDVTQDPIGRMLGYGNILIQTAATQGETIIKQVEKPILLRETILESAEIYRTKNIYQNKNILETNTDLDTRECPYCYETIKKRAIVCRFCGRDITPENNKQTEVLQQQKNEQEIKEQGEAKQNESLAPTPVDINEDVANKLLQDCDNNNEKTDKDISCNKNDNPSITSFLTKAKKESPTLIIDAIIKNTPPINIPKYNYPRLRKGEDYSENNT